ncbi:hypothetical protein P280DRAFT_468612 [Massarina eburnea CBS 473.64]|uniref:FAD/NAD(P)-binding domain-containing protein n=1 Tax=Massarina eburnea CBS 473.64 TaxID=1395130 RepID=A0A6A6S4X9_9PLEO|nr:hypothetical protein P280DRAFT_468612 [Massarina eburnea CBS 473.64]
MAARLFPSGVDTVIVGNGPSALILSYILHGHTPYYTGSHHDTILDQKLLANAHGNLLHLTPDLYAHFLSSLRYSTQALPINTLLDTLLRPNADTEINPTSCIQWRHEPSKAIPHLVIGETSRPGGQWASGSDGVGETIGTLSYAEQLSLPGYTYREHVAAQGKLEEEEEEGEEEDCDFVRPTRAQVAEYLSAYPAAVGIADSVHTATRVENVYRTRDSDSGGDGGGFMIGSLGIRCKHLVLASGIFTHNIPPPRLLAPIANRAIPEEPLLVIGSGFSAADAIISAPVGRRVIHVYRWEPEMRPSPLRGCHRSAYPEYANIYRQMKLAALSAHRMNSAAAATTTTTRKSNTLPPLYQGHPNAQILTVTTPPNATATTAATVTLRLASGAEIAYKVGGLAYLVGRRGTLDFLSPSLCAEVLPSSPSPSSSSSSSSRSSSPHHHHTPLISTHTLRPKTATSLEVAPRVFVVGSLAGDSLIRHAVGGCVFAAGRVMGVIAPTLAEGGCENANENSKSNANASSKSKSRSESRSSSVGRTPLSCSPGTGTGTAGKIEEGEREREESSTRPSTPHSSRGQLESSTTTTTTTTTTTIPANVNGHEHLHLDRRELAHAVDIASAENANAVWGWSGWWGGGFSVGGRRA